MPAAEPGAPRLLKHKRMNLGVPKFASYAPALQARHGAGQPAAKARLPLVAHGYKGARGVETNDRNWTTGRGLLLASNSASGSERIRFSVFSQQKAPEAEAEAEADPLCLPRRHWAFRVGSGASQDN